jgi:hypothetical protein
MASLVNDPISFTDCDDLSASLPTSVATTEKPLPASPALEASIGGSFVYGRRISKRKLLKNPKKQPKQTDQPSMTRLY